METFAQEASRLQRTLKPLSF